MEDPLVWSDLDTPPYEAAEQYAGAIGAMSDMQIDRYLELTMESYESMKEQVDPSGIGHALDYVGFADFDDLIYQCQREAMGAEHFTRFIWADRARLVYKLAWNKF